MIAVGLSPRTAAKQTIRRRGATAERLTKTAAFNRRSATPDHNAPHPWTEVHGYHHCLAPRGGAGASPWAGMSEVFGLPQPDPAQMSRLQGQAERLPLHRVFHGRPSRSSRTISSADFAPALGLTERNSTQSTRNGLRLDLKGTSFAFG